MDEEKVVANESSGDNTPLTTEEVANGSHSKPGVGDVENKKMERQVWGNKVDFVLSCVGYAVGLGNVWRFPYMCFKNGGAVFLIPYIICLVCCGIPLFYLELVIGQYLSLGTIGAWSVICPMLKGLGYSIVVVNTLLSIYYNVIMAWGFVYLFNSFRSEVPWKTCGNSWNSLYCKADRSLGGNATFNCTAAGLSVNCSAKYVSPAEEYYNNYVLQITDGVDKLGELRFPIAMCLLLAWALVFLCIWKGIRSSGKVVYFSATFPYVVLTILLIRGVTLEGAGNGILYYLKPDIHRLGDARVWLDAAGQIFYSLGTGYGGLITYASYNKFHNNCHRDTIIVSLINCFTSFYAGFVIFSMMGYMAHVLNTDVASVAQSGPGLAFIAYPEGIARMPISPLWAILFFLMLFTLGLDGQFVNVEVCVTALVDKYPKILRPRKLYLTLALCVAFFLCGLVMCTQGGVYVLEIFNYQSGGVAVMLIAVCEAYIIGWIYGTERFSRNIESMLGTRPGRYYVWSWKYLVPFIITVIFFWSIVSWKGISYGNYIYPPWAELCGWLVAVSIMIWIPGFAIYKYCRAQGSFRERIRDITKPNRKTLAEVERKHGIKYDEIETYRL